MKKQILKGGKDMPPYSHLTEGFDSANLPAAPFRLRSGVEVTDPQRFYASLRNDIEQGEGGARARTGALQEDLVGLFDLFNDAEGPRNS